MEGFKDFSNSGLQNLSLNRFLGKQDFDVSQITTTPFQGVSPYLNNNSSLVYDNPINRAYAPARSISPGTIISNILVRTSSGVSANNTFNGRVELNQGFTQKSGAPFPFDTLTAFNPEGDPSVVLFHSGVIFNETATGVPLLVYQTGGNQYSQPIVLGSGRVLDDGTPTTNFPVGWTSVQNGTGDYTLTPPANFPTSDYGVNLTVVNSVATITLANPTASSFDVLTFDPTTATPIDSEFSFMAFTNNQ